MSGTTAFLAKDRLKALLDASPDLTTVDRWYAYEGAAQEMPRECVWLGEIEWEYEKPAQMGNLSRTEEYKILLTIEVHRPGDTQREANLRVEALMQTVEGLLRQRNPLGIPNTESIGIEPQLLGEGRDADGRGAILVTAVRVRVRK